MPTPGPVAGPAVPGVLAALAICLATAGAPVEAACRDDASPFEPGCLSVELSALYQIEAWDENESRDTAAGATVAIMYAFSEGWALVGEGVGYRVALPTPTVRLGGGIGLIRRQLYERGRLSMFGDAGLGVSYAEAPVPTRGTRFNYLLQAGVGLTSRLTSRLDLIGHVRHLHVSNNGLAGSSRNPDIQSLGVQLGILMRLGQLGETSRIAD